MSQPRSLLRRQLPPFQALQSVSALYHVPRRGVSYITQLLHLEPHLPRVNFIIVWALFEGGVNFA